MADRRLWLLRTLARALLLWPLLIAGPALAVETLLVGPAHALYDFQGGLYNAGVAILHGRSPYQPGFLAHQIAIMRAGGIARGETSAHPFSIPVYPAFANLLATPFALAPLWLAGALYTLASVAAMLGGIWLLGVRDRRCLSLVVISWPFLYGVYLGAIGPFLVLGAGVAWRWRDRIWPPALGIATIVAIKIFPWTLAVWLLITRRSRAFAASVIAGLVLTAGAWMAIGWHGLAQYPQMLSDMSTLQEGRAQSLVNALVVAGISPAAASGAAIVLALGILAIAWRLAGGQDGDRSAFGLAIIAALTGTPIVWSHYMVLLFIPVALASPRLSRLWLAPVLTPILIVLSPLLIPATHSLRPDSPEALRSTLPWLAAELVVAVALTTTAAQRAAWRHAVGRRLRVGRAPAVRPGSAPAVTR